uniref:Uncharacterized protein n=1 Tax=Anguilla anguilla TaxID=7936 RepID=A0A0E9PTY2_ANGAN
MTAIVKISRKWHSRGYRLRLSVLKKALSHSPTQRPVRAGPNHQK